MSQVNFGSQVVLWNYGTEYKSLTFGRLLDGMNIEGVLSGLEVTASGDTSILISTGIAIIKNKATLYTTEPVTAKIHFTQSFSLTIVPAVVQIALRYEYDDEAVSYASIVTSGILPDDIILCDILWSGSVIAGIGYENTDYSILKNLSKNINKIKLVPVMDGFGISNKLKVKEDVHIYYLTSANIYTYKLLALDTETSSISDTTTARVDLIEFNVSDGTLNIKTSGTTTPPNTTGDGYIPLAIISRGINRNNVTEDDIIYI